MPTSSAPNIAPWTPYILFFFGLIITYIGWTTKKILENIESAIKKTSSKVEIHETHINDINSTLKIHHYRIDQLERVVDSQKDDKMD